MFYSFKDIIQYLSLILVAMIGFEDLLLLP